MKDDQKHRILFVCMGNICRSPLAEGLFRHKANQRRVIDRFVIDSAGTGGWHAGEPPDPRMQRTAEHYGVKLSSRARQVKKRDIDQFDYFICMDEENLHNVLQLGIPRERAHLLLEFHPDTHTLEVPDPYYGGDEGFDTVYRLVDKACDALLDRLLNETNEH